MKNEPIIKYYSTNLSKTESIMIYEDRIIYIKSNLTITNKFADTISKEQKIEISDKFFVNSIILGNIYMPIKQDIIDIYTKVNNMDVKDLHRPKNTARKDIIINDKDFTANIDMFVEEFGIVFDNLISNIKKVLMLELNK